MAKQEFEQGDSNVVVRNQVVYGALPQDVIDRMGDTTLALQTTEQNVLPAINELKSNLIQCAVLTTSINISYQDANSIGYRNTVANAVDITTIQGYPTGKTIIGAIPVGNEAIISATFAIVNGTELHATSKISGTRSCTIYVLYTD